MPLPRPHNKKAFFAALLCAVSLALSPIAQAASPAAKPAGAVSAAVSVPASAPAPAPRTPSAAAYPAPFDVAAQAVYLVNTDTGLVMYEKESQKSWQPASLVKMMTAILAVESIPDLDGTRITCPRAVQDALYKTGSSVADIRPGETFTAKQLLYALLLPSGNDAALILAMHIGKGNVQNFVFMMNAKAQELGCLSTNYANPHGLSHPSQLTTAYDQYLIARKFMTYPVLMEIAQTSTYVFPDVARYKPGGWVLLSTNKMQMTAFKDRFYRPYVKGIKTGSLPEAGSNFASSAQKDKENYVMVVLGATGEPQYSHFYVTAKLYDWVLDSFDIKSALDFEKPVTEVKVKYSADADSLLLYPKGKLDTLLPKESDLSAIRKEFQLPPVLKAPIKAGEVVGTVSLYVAERKIGTVEVVAGREVKRNLFVYLIDKIKEFFGSLYFKVLVALLLLLAIAYVGYAYHLHLRDQRNQKVKRGGDKI